MDHFGVILSLIGVMFLAIIGVYIWTYKVYKDTNHSLGEVYKTVNGHIQSADIHTSKNEFVNADVCKVVHENLAKNVDEIKKDVKCLLGKVKG